MDFACPYTALISSTKCSRVGNRIEGVTVAAGRIDPLVLKRAAPRDRSVKEVSGYRDALARIHADSGQLDLSTEEIRSFHRDMYRYTNETGGRWKRRDNAFLEVGSDGRQVVRFHPVSALATPKYMRRLVELHAREMGSAKIDPLLLAALLRRLTSCWRTYRKICSLSSVVRR